MKKKILVFLVTIILLVGFVVLIEPVYSLVYGSADEAKDELTILDVHSSPQKGDNWEVEFTTRGTNDLRIIPNDQATIDDIDFISLKCGDEERTPQILEGDVIFYPNWYCFEEAEIVHIVNVAAKHTLKFQFGKQTAYAYNNPGVEMGISAGFVTVAPTADPGGGNHSIDDNAMAMKDVAPAGATKVVEIGWYSGWSGGAANYQVGIYSHNADDDEPETLLGYAESATGGTGGWKTAAVDIAISEGTTYWITSQCDDTEDSTVVDFSIGSERTAYKFEGQTELTNPWGTSTGFYTTSIHAIYAVYETGAPPSVITNAATSVQATTATLNGNVTSDGGATITERGFYCDTNASPSTKYTVAGTTGAYTKGMTTLSSGTKYYVKAFATNSEGTSYGDILNFTTESPPPPPSPCEDHNVQGWAWSENIGWISFSCRNRNNVGEGVDYGVDINLSTGEFSGYAWAGGGENADGSLAATIGWISFDGAQLDRETGEVSGWARAYRAIEPEGQTLGGWDGWIKLSGTWVDGVSFNTSTNEFEGWAWGSDVVGWISFNCQDGGYDEVTGEDSSSIAGETSDGYIYGEDGDYGIARSESVDFNDEVTYMYVGIDYEAGGGGGGCTGTPDSCDSFDITEECNSAGGCFWEEGCTGTATSCDSFDNRVYNGWTLGCGEFSWQPQYGCYWQACGGTAASCDSFDSDETGCGNQFYCSWHGCTGSQTVPCSAETYQTDPDFCEFVGCSWDGCAGTATSCGSFGDQSSCEGQDLCSWIDSGYGFECTGTATPCDSFDSDETGCGNQDGCSWDGCTGSPGPCSSFDSSVCDSILGCSWEGCWGSAIPCTHRDLEGWPSSPDDCEQQDGCSWQACEGTATSCDSLNEPACPNQDGCSWEEGCAGTADSCGSYGSESGCNAQPGCSWAGGAEGEELRVYRDYLSFDTSSIPDDAIITDVKLSLKTIGWDGSDTDFDVQIYKFNWAEPITSANIEANYDAVGAVYDADWRNTSGMSTRVYYDSSSLDNSWVNKTGDTKYQLRSKEDVDNSEPANDEYIGFYSANSAGNKPILKVTYTTETAGERYNICETSNYKVTSDLNQSPNKPTGLNESWGCCGGTPQAALRTCLILNWSYSDPDGDPQTAYEIWLDETSNFSSPKFNNVVDPGPAPSYTVDLTADEEGDWLDPPPLPGGLVWATTYWWKVMVKDSNDGWSGFSDAKSFTMPNRASPAVDFTPNPINPRTGEVVAFIDGSKCYLSNDSSYSCKDGGADITYEWDFGDGETTSQPTDEPMGDTTHTYPKAGNYIVQLQITDIGVGGPFTGMCWKEVIIGFPLPTWKEVTPF